MSPVRLYVPDPKPVARRCCYCGRKSGAHPVCLVCQPLPAADPLDAAFWLAEALLERVQVAKQAAA